MFRDWFRTKYDQWSQGKYGWDASQVAFARHLGINQKSVNEYLSGEAVPKHLKTINKLVRVYGEEVYGVLGIKVTKQEEIWIEINQIPPDQYADLLKQIREFRASYKPPPPAHKDSSEDPNG